MTNNINRHKWHYFQLIPISWWPIYLSINIFSLFISLIYLFININNNSLLFIFFSIFNIVTTLLLWWRDMLRESMFGHHTSFVQLNLRISMILFITSEIMLFFPFFWSFFTASWSPTIEIYCVWPPLGINTISWNGFALLGTLILLSSGLSITICHYAIINNNLKHFKKYMIITIVLACIFLCIQINEYIESSFNLSDSIYATSFYILTGLHGTHVFLGTCFICYSLYISKHYTPVEHLSFELCSWYWHFVDVVWLLLYIFIYILNGLY